jgi:DNA-binding NtrC family response regulator
MHRNHLVIMELAPHFCPGENRIELPTLIRRCFPAEAIDLHHVEASELHDLPRKPDLGLLRTSVTMPVSRLLPPLRKSWGRIPIIGLFCAGGDSPDEVVTSLSCGLDDFLVCPFREIDLIPRIRRLLHINEEYHKPSRIPATGRQFRLDSLVGECDCFVREVQKIPLLADSDATVLISGETGTGKELFARAIHYHSLRKGKPFIPVNCGALPDLLFENELFGHTRGAFTNAFSQQQGLVAEAQGGTLFLDEIDTLSASAQTKLLRFLQDRQYRPLGSSKSITADVRIIAATNTDLCRQINRKQFREDLYYRLNVLNLCVPSLRQRSQDIPLLANHFINRYGKGEGTSDVRFTTDALQKLLAYDWPGNVRELEGVIHRVLILAKSPVIEADDLELPMPAQEMVETGTLRLAKACTVREFERAYLTRLLTAHEGNITHASKAAGKDRRTLQRLLHKYGLERQAFQGRS